MNYKTRVFPAALASLLLASAAAACLWDSDTLQMERLRFPGVLEIITGKFVRHSRAYYEWRIPDRLKKLEAAPNEPALIDDLAVAYDKLGRPEEGIVLLEKSLEKNPDRYETLANLATLLFHAGKLEESKQYVERALEINPNAHFGREKYQLLLTEYVLQSELKTTGVMSSEERSPYGEPKGFAKFVLTKFPTADRAAEIKAAGKGVLGMLHFADHTSPVLLEALGDLLLTGEMHDNGTHLAARAYLRAAQGSGDPKVSALLRDMANRSLKTLMQYREEKYSEPLLILEQRLAEETAAGEAWFAEIEAKEKQWIREDRDVDQAFAAVYYDSLETTVAEAEKSAEVALKQEREASRQRIFRLQLINGLLCVGLPLLAIGAVAAVVISSRRRQVFAKSKPIEQAKSA